MSEPKSNPNPGLLVNPPGFLRSLIAMGFSSVTDTAKIEAQRRQAEAKRARSGAPHVVEYFHQLDDPYSHLTAQVLAKFADSYGIELRCHLIPAVGGANQPMPVQLEQLARRDAEMVAPYFKLDFPKSAPVKPDMRLVRFAGAYLAKLDGQTFIRQIDKVSKALWSGDERGLLRLIAGKGEDGTGLAKSLEAGAELHKKLGHYSGATFFYGGEWYWGVDRLFHLEKRLMTLGVCKAGQTTPIAPRPLIFVDGVDASALTLDFYPSLNSPYTSIIFDRTIAMAETCGIRLNHKPVLPMIMRGVPITRAKGRYIMFDTKREADYAGVPFGKMLTPIGKPTRMAYSLLPWARSLGKDITMMSEMLRHAFSMGVGLHTRKGFRRAVEAAGLDWNEARQHLGTSDWIAEIEENQRELNRELGLWGVPGYRLRGPDGEPDLVVWGQDRLWLVAAEIRRRGVKNT